MKRILTIQDISCVGQCSLTVALPIISAFGIETSVIPTAVLSTHTAFNEFTFCDLTNELPKIESHFIKENIKFSGFYTGYVGSIEQISYIKSIMNSCALDGTIKVIDPCMADNGVLYKGFSKDFPKKMLELCKCGDYILPNITEACLLLGIEYRQFDKDEYKDIVMKLSEITEASVVLTGVSYVDGRLGALAYDYTTKCFYYYDTEKLSFTFHGTGDCFASSFFGSIIKGYGLEKACKIACEFTYLAIFNTISDSKEHWYGVHFEPALKYITNLD